MPSKSHQNQLCRLCHQHCGLVKSHIVPEFLHRPVYDDDHTALFVDLETERVGERKTGFWQHLLCRECEGRIGRLESYFADVWFNRELRPRPVIDPNGPLLRVTGLDYTQFKLFHLSILWRAGVSTLGPFVEFRLGPHQDRIRQLLLAGDPGEAHQYGMSAIAMVGDDGWYKDDMVQIPRPGKRFGHHFYSAMFGGVTARQVDVRSETPLGCDARRHFDPAIHAEADERNRHRAIVTVVEMRQWISDGPEYETLPSGESG